MYLLAVWRFLGLQPIDAERAEHAEYYLRPERTKLNSTATYLLLPNAREIDAVCGSDATGWLFSDGGNNTAL